MKNIVIVIILFLAVVVAYFGYSQGWLPLTEEAGIISDNDREYFMEKMLELGARDVGESPEGFNYTRLSAAFPGLFPEDFNGVKTFQGHYEFEGNTLKFVRDSQDAASINEQDVSAEGYKKLLENISARFQTVLDTERAIDDIIARINTDND